MPDFIFAYHGGTIPETEEEQQKSMAAWGAWFGTMESILKDPGNPVGKSKTVSAAGVEDHGGPNPLSGYTIITVSDEETALNHAKGCPICDEGGSVEVVEIIPFEM